MSKNSACRRNRVRLTIVLLQVRSNQYGGTLRAFNGYPLTPGPALVQAVDHALRRVCHQLIHGAYGTLTRTRNPAALCGMAV